MDWIFLLKQHKEKDESQQSCSLTSELHKNIYRSFGHLLQKGKKILTIFLHYTAKYSKHLLLYVYFNQGSNLQVFWDTTALVALQHHTIKEKRDLGVQWSGWKCLHRQSKTLTQSATAYQLVDVCHTLTVQSSTLAA